MRRQQNMERHINILIGCNEPLVVDALRILLTTTAQDGKAFEFTTSSRCDEFIPQARSGSYDLGIMHANCLSPTRPFTLLEHSVYTIRSIKSSCPLRLVVLTTMDEWIEPLRSAGADVCLKTPFAANELLDAISALV